jgi:hypothetical protein
MHRLRHVWRNLPGCSHSSMEVTVELIENGFVKSCNSSFFVIPAKAGIQ